MEVNLSQLLTEFVRGRLVGWLLPIPYHKSTFGCLHLGQWPMTYLMTLSDWTMSCQPWPPRARYGQ